MQPGDPATAAAQAEAAWAAFVQQLADQLAALWPAMPERLGERYGAFVEHAVQQAQKRGLSRAAAVARYVNLCFVWGPAFQDKPGFEWAQGLLAAPRDREWATSHQLLQRSLTELGRMPDARIDAASLAAADQHLLERFGALGQQGDLHPAEPAPLPRSACDLEAVELRLLEAANEQQYELLAGVWQRVPLPAPPPLRVTAADPVPRLLAALSNAPNSRTTARLQLRSRCHAQCDGNVHPALLFSGTHGQYRWLGHQTRAVSWPLATLEQPGPAGGPGSAVAEETSPDIFKLDLQVCGLRDEGDALGSMSTLFWVWPAAQWWLELQRDAAAVQPVLAGQPPGLRGSTRCRVERDGDSEDTLPLRQSFERGLDAATDSAMQSLLTAWSRVEGLSAVRLEGQLALLTGRAALTWGWRLGPGGLDGRALLRLVGELALRACQSELHFEGELALGGARSRLLLHNLGSAPLAAQIRRESADPPLLAALAPAQVQFQLPFSAELTPLASDSGTLLMLAGPCSGALEGVAGLRPRTSGGSGFEWFVLLRLQAASLPLLLSDPILGRRTFNHPLWAEQTLIDWRLA